MTKKQIIEAIEKRFEVINIDGDFDLPHDKQFVTDKTSRDLITGLTKDDILGLCAVTQYVNGGGEEFLNMLIELSGADLTEILEIMNQGV